MAVAISGCATMPQEKASDLMRGWTRADVLACAGAPLREATDGNLIVMSYSNSREVNATVFRCEVSLSLRGGFVDNVRYRGAGNVCAAILRGCQRG